MIYGHGDDFHKYKNIRINFSSNVCPGGMSLGLKKHLASCLESSSSYPEPRARELELFIKQKYNLNKGTVLVTNGAVEAFYLIASWKRKCKSLIYVPSFSEYKDACSRYEHELEFKPNSELITTQNYNHDVVWMCNPNNPDGKVFSRASLQAVISKNTNTLFVVDEAYIEFVSEDISIINLLAKYKNLIVIRSLTKRYSIPGLRIGYLAAAPEIISELEKSIIPWRINVLAQKAGLYCLSDENKDDFNLPKLIAESKRLQHEIGKIDGFKVEESDTTFFLCKAHCKASVLKNELAEKHAILIRDASNFRGLGAYHFRISSQLPPENNKLIETLRNNFSVNESTKERRYKVYTQC